MPAHDATPSEKSSKDKMLQRISTCARERSSKLNLDGCYLTKIPSEIFQLSHLRHLVIGHNELKALPAEISKLTNLEELNLSGNHLETLPVELAQLTNLTSLNVGSNNLAKLPEVVGRLRGLRSLEVYKNRLKELPDWIGDFAELEELVINANPLTGLPDSIRRLQKLERLYLGRGYGGCPLGQLPKVIRFLGRLKILDANRCELISLPHWLSELTTLASLLVSGNKINALPAEVGKLGNLKRLDLEGNRLTSLPPQIGQLTNLLQLQIGKNRLSSLPPEIGNLASLKELDVVANRLTALPERIKNLVNLSSFSLHGNASLGLSPAILGGHPDHDGDSASPKSILDFYFGRKQGKTRPLNEVKLILVGRGGAGKTSTVNALRDMPFHEGEESTPGIALCDWTMNGCNGQPVTAHVWDFAGQVITHALHQFFFSVRSVYVVVLTGRENNERDDAEYWLRLIKAFGTDEKGNGPPVVVALNKWDVPGCRPRVDRGVLRERYPFIRSFVEIDCKSKKGVPKLKTALCREVSRLKWVREPFPESWDAVRRSLSMGRSRQAHLTYVEYRALCVKHGITDEGHQDSLSEILHNLGAALNYRKDPRLREATVLQPEWLTKHVYALVRRAERQAGVLRQSDVDAVLRAERDKTMRTYLVQIMERFEIAYAPRTSIAGVWLVPQALPDAQPKGAEAFRDAVNATRLRYIYQALPEGLVARSIVRLHEFIEEIKTKKQQWGSGAVLVRESARALIRTEPQDRQVMITVTGPAKARQQLAGLCQAEMRDIHREIPGLDPLEETQVQGAWVATATLEVDERTGRKTGISTKDRGTVDVDPKEPNNAYSEQPSRSDDVWKPAVFISYSKNNITQRKRLESELKILKNEGLLERGWHDRMIDPGDKWDVAIQKELSDADVIIVLASSAALSTDYITDHEIPKALELHNAGTAVVVPVVLESCRWDKTELGTLNALPEKAKPLNTWARHSDAWKSVADGLAKVFERLIREGSSKERQTASVSINRDAKNR